MGSGGRMVRGRKNQHEKKKKIKVKKKKPRRNYCWKKTSEEPPLYCIPVKKQTSQASTPGRSDSYKKEPRKPPLWSAQVYAYAKTGKKSAMTELRYTLSRATKSPPAGSAGIPTNATS